MAPNFTQQEGNNCPKCRWSSCVAKVLTILDISLSAAGNAGVGLSGMDFETL